jgi:hypothetical protein
VSPSQESEHTLTLDSDAPGTAGPEVDPVSTPLASASVPGGSRRIGLSNLSGSGGRSAFQDQTHDQQGSPQAAPTELVLEGRTHTDPNGVGWTLRDDDYCPVAGALAFDRTTGEVVWRPTCKSARCRRCSRQVSAQTFALARRALEPVKNVRFITLTLAPEGWQTTRKAMQDWVQRLRRAGYTMHTLWVVEQGSQHGMKHVHVIQWGSYIPKHALDASWPYGWNEIEGARQATSYLSKGVIRYVAKELDGDGESIESHMNLNGGRAAHWSLNFFGGMGRNAYRKANPLPGIYFVNTVRPRKELADGA